MQLPFTAEQFFGVFRAYNTTLWPAQLFLLALTGMVIFLVVWPPYRETPTFGLPCPTTIFTMGLLACLVRPCPRSVFVVPVLWSLVGVQAAFLLAVPQDLGLAVVAVVGLVLITRARSPAAPSPASAPEQTGALP